jgi:hypothetical protein
MRSLQRQSQLGASPARSLTYGSVRRCRPTALQRPLVACQALSIGEAGLGSGRHPLRPAEAGRSTVPEESRLCSRDTSLPASLPCRPPCGTGERLSQAARARGAAFEAGCHSEVRFRRRRGEVTLSLLFWRASSGCRAAFSKPLSFLWALTFSQVTDEGDLQAIFNAAGNALVLVFCSRPSCGACKDAAKVFEQLRQEAQNARARVFFVRHSIESPYGAPSELSLQWRVRAVPAFLFLDGGAVVSTIGSGRSRAARQCLASTLHLLTAGDRA